MGSDVADNPITFESHDVANLLSVAHLFPKSKGRTGIYVLHFNNGEGYVGQSLNVVGRWATHRRRWDDITRLEFARVPRARLNEVERAQIRSRTATGLSLRNVSHAIGSETAESDLDFVIERSDQFAWLNREGDDELPDDQRYVDDPELRAAKRPRYLELLQRPEYGIVADLLHVYIQLAVPRPRATEMTFWALSAMPSTNRSTWPRLAAVSINTMETMVLGYFHDEPQTMWGFINLSKRALEASGTTVENVLKRHPHAWSDGVGHYATSGYDAVIFQFGHPDDVLHAIIDAEFLHAARALNLQLMRKGPTIQWHGHCFDLADDVLELDDSDANKTAESIKESTRDATHLPGDESIAVSAVDAISPDEPSDGSLPAYRAFVGNVVPVAEATRDELIDGLRAIVECEGPILGARLREVYVKASGRSRGGRQSAKTLDAAISAAIRRGVLVSVNPLNARRIDARTYRLPEQPQVELRQLGPRSLDEVPPGELIEHMRSAAEALGWDDDDDALYRAVLRRFGLARLTTNVRKRLTPIRQHLTP